MKKQSSLFLSALTAGFILTLSVLNVSAAQITADNAKSIALQNANIEEQNISLIHIEQDLENGRTIFDVEFMTKTYEEYNYEILAETGEILGISYENKAYRLPSEGFSADAMITLENAGEIALNHAKTAADQAVFIKKKTDFEDGNRIYKLEFYTPDYREYEYEIDGKSGEIISWSFDSDSSHARQDAAQKGVQANSTAISDTQTDTQSSENSVSLENAKATALKTAGLQDEQVTWGRTYKEYDDGRLLYKGKFFYKSFEYEFEIDTVTGAVVDWDIESIFD